MTIKELRDAIADLDDDLLVVMSKDGEGNNFSPLSSLGEASYLALSTWSGELLYEDDEDYDESDDDRAVPALVLWPTN